MRTCPKLALVVIGVLLLSSLGFISADTSIQDSATELTQPAGPLPMEDSTTLADASESLDFTVDEYDYKIYVCQYSKSHTNTTIKYEVTFTVSGGTLEFFICTESEASTWAAYIPIYISSDDHWGSTSGVTVMRSFHSNVAFAFVFNNEHTGNRTISGSVNIDTTGPEITTSLINNATYSGDVPITASATDAMSGVKYMSLFIDRDEKGSWESSSFSYNWRTSSFQNGNHTIRVIAVDEFGHVSSKVFQVWVQNNPFAYLSESVPIIIGAGVSFGCLLVCASGCRRKKKEPVPSWQYPPSGSQL